MQHEVGGLVAMIGVYGPTARITGETRQDITRAVVNAARRLAKAL